MYVVCAVVCEAACCMEVRPGLYNNDRLTAFDPGQPG